MYKLGLSCGECGFIPQSSLIRMLVTELRWTLQSIRSLCWSFIKSQTSQLVINFLLQLSMSANSSQSYVCTGNASTREPVIVVNVRLATNLVLEDWCVKVNTTFMDWVTSWWEDDPTRKKKKTFYLIKSYFGKANANRTFYFALFKLGIHNPQQFFLCKPYVLLIFWYYHVFGVFLS